MISVELELSEDGYVRLCRLCERYGKAGGNPALSHVLALAIETGIKAQEQILDLAARQTINRLPS